MNYTKGEWKTDDVTITIDKKLIAVVYDPEKPESYTGVCKANARLIAAAVNACQAVNPENPMAVAESIKEMYEALKWLCKLYEIEPKGEGGYLPSWNHALQALAKAKGREKETWTS